MQATSKAATVAILIGLGLLPACGGGGGGGRGQAPQNTGTTAKGSVSLPT